MASLLIIDDDPVYLLELGDGLIALKHAVVTCETQKDAIAKFRPGKFDLVLCDTIMEGGGALTMLHHIRTVDPNVAFVVITGRPEIASSPLFEAGMKEATAKIDKSMTLFEIDQLIRNLVR